MRCQTGAAEANDPRRVNNHLQYPEFPPMALSSTMAIPV